MYYTKLLTFIAHHANVVFKLVGYQHQFNFVVTQFYSISRSNRKEGRLCSNNNYYEEVWPLNNFNICEYGSINFKMFHIEQLSMLIIKEIQSVAYKKFYTLKYPPLQKRKQPPKYLKGTHVTGSQKPAPAHLITIHYTLVNLRIYKY